MRVGWPAVILGFLLVFSCSRVTKVEKRDGGAAPSQEAGGGGFDASGVGRDDGSAGSGAHPGGGISGSTGGRGGGSTGGTEGGTSSMGRADGETDGIDAGAADAGADGSLAAFCTGALPRMKVNGVESGPAVLGTLAPLNCCYAAQFFVTTQTFQHIIVVLWSAQVGATTGFPANIDLANPPPGWTVQVDIDCEPMQAECNPAPDSYTTGLQGSLQVDRSSSSYDMTLCLSAAESAGDSHPIVHSLWLYAPHVAAGY